ncbi:MAG: hypothetical protein NDJ92_15095 [Thermoanaerobaculia bacterium]|nr:hypothetical protein [Thermoanaerobaculia bacterium]
MTGSTGPTPRAFARALLALLCLGWAVRIAFCLAVPPEIHSVDVDGWKMVADAVRAGENPYAATSKLNWPPLWLGCIILLDRVASVTGLAFERILQTFLIATESIVIVLVARLVLRIDDSARWFAILAIGLAVNPVMVLLICQHGNFDILVTLWIVLTLHSAISYARSGDRRDWLRACGFLGLGVLTKSVPIALVPLLAPGFKGSRLSDRVIGAGLVTLPTAISFAVLALLSPAALLDNVLLYRSFSGVFGITGLLDLAGLYDLRELAILLLPLLFLAILVVCTVAFWKSERVAPERIVLAAAMIMLAIPVLGPGFGPQYIHWFLPLLIVTWAPFSRRWRFALGSSLAITIPTYIGIYALTPSLGMFAARMLPPATAAEIARQMERSDVQTLITLPMFLSWCVVLATGIAEFRSGGDRVAA